MVGPMKIRLAIDVAIPTETCGTIASCSYMLLYYGHFPTALRFTIIGMSIAYTCN